MSSITKEHESGIDSMEFKVPGRKSVTITGDEAGSALDKLGQATERLKEAHGQLSFRVGGDAEGERLIGSLTVSGSIPVTENLDLGDEIQVRIVNAAGEVLATVAAEIGAPNFKTHRDKYGSIVAIERAHKGKVIDS